MARESTLKGIRGLFVSSNVGSTGLSIVALAAVCLGPVITVRATEQAEENSGNGRSILTERSWWRCHVTHRIPVFRINNEIKKAMKVYHVRDPLERYSSPLPPNNWATPEFERDDEWSRLRGPCFSPGVWKVAVGQPWFDAGFHRFQRTRECRALVCIRGRFRIADLAQTGELTLSVAYRGGVVAYVNGKEVARGHLPKERKGGLEALADDYPAEAFIKKDAAGKNIGEIRWGWGDPKKYASQLKLRVRRLERIRIPRSHLRAGVNVLAIELHRAPYHGAALSKGMSLRKYDKFQWSTVGLVSLDLRATGSGVLPNTRPPKELRVWNQPMLQPVEFDVAGDGVEPLRPIRLSGPRGAVVCGQVVAASAEPVNGLRATCTGFQGSNGEGALPAECAETLYATVNYPVSKFTRNKAQFWGLSPTPPTATPMVSKYKKGHRAVQPIWLRVRIPRVAKPGTYESSLTITAQGQTEVSVPVTLDVIDWDLPDPREFAAHMDIIQSPDSVAMQYNLKPWSREHWAQMAKSFKLMGDIGARTVFIPLIRRTHFGNEHSMVRWIRKGDGWEHDFSIAEGYVDLAVKHLGKLKSVCLYLWDVANEGSGGRANPANWGQGAVGAQFTILNSGKLEEAEGPKWSNPASEAFWRPVLEGMLKRLRARGLQDVAMVGMSGDRVPTKEVVNTVKKIAPNLKWFSTSHPLRKQVRGQPVGYAAHVWARPAPEPSKKRCYGWKDSPNLMIFPRGAVSGPINPGATPANLLLGPEILLAAGYGGYGRLGADFWPVIKDWKKGTEHMLKNTGVRFRSFLNRPTPVCGRYPVTFSGWGQLNLFEAMPCMLEPGKDGPFTTIGYELLRSGMQLSEARVAIERCLLDPGKRARLGKPLALRMQRLLDERINNVTERNSNGWIRSPWWKASNRALYDAAARVADGVQTASAE